MRDTYIFIRAYVAWDWDIFQSRRDISPRNSAVILLEFLINFCIEGMRDYT